MVENFIFFVFSLALTYIANRKNLFPNFTGDIHQKFFNEKKIPLIGGVLVLVTLLRFYYAHDYFINLVFLSIFLIGFFSDSKILSSPRLRLYLQLLITIIFVLYFKIEVTPTKLNFFDNLLQNHYLSYSFTIFCFMILINGSNFIDGLNGLLLGYILLIFFALTTNDLILFSGLDELAINYLFYSLILIIVLNYFNFLYLGDSGAYLLGLFTGYILITIYNSPAIVSPYYIILLLWYPCFENLFSLLRKFLNSQSPVKPDNRHLHQIIFLFLKYKFKSKNILLINIISSLTINFYNLVIFFIASKNPNLTILQLKLILVSIFIYCILYYILNKRIHLFIKK